MTRSEPEKPTVRNEVRPDTTAEKPGHPPGNSPAAPPDDDHDNLDHDHDDHVDEDENDQTGSEDAAGQDPETQSQEERKKRRPTVLIVALLVLGGLALSGIYWWLSTLNVESTDDAYTEGRAITISPQVAGRVASLDVTDNQFVRKGQALIHLDPRQFINTRDQMRGAVENARAQLAARKYGAEIAKKNFPAALQVAQANLASAKANLERRQADFARQKSLPRQATTQQEVDGATAALQQAQAQVLQAQAQVTQAEPVQQNIETAIAQVGQQSGALDQAVAQLHQADLDLSHTVVRAPQDGWITRRNVEQGHYVTAGQQIMSIVSPDVWIVANFKETQLNLMRPGQSVHITVDAYPDLHLRGHVDSIQLGSGSKFTAFPAENATGNFVKIVQRVPVKILIDKGLDPTLPLPLGLSVEPTVTVR